MTDPSIEYVRKAFSYDADSGHLFKNGRRVGWVHPTGYRYVQIGDKQHKEHRIIWMLCKGCEPPEQIDHINGERDDNRIENLRAATPSQNQGNKCVRRDSALGVKGVTPRHGKFIARICGDNGRVHLGTFDTLSEAKRAYAAAAIKRFESYARL